MIGGRRRRKPHSLTPIVAALTASACSPLNIFDTLVPKESEVRLVAKDAAFGNDPRQRIDVYGPRERVGAKLPIIVFIYGGSWRSGSKSDYSFVGRALAARGFIVAIPDYRLVPKIHYPAFLEDNSGATKWVIANAHSLRGDPDKVILAGHSAGAYDAAMLALDPRWLGNDRSHVRGLIGLAGPYDFLPLTGDVLGPAFVGAYDPPATQPVNYVRRGAPAAFLATGDQDDFVRPHNSDSLARKLRDVGVTVERKTYPGVGHIGLLTAIARPFRRRASVLDDMAEFAHKVTR